jgi:subtilisin family serine protease
VVVKIAESFPIALGQGERLSPNQLAAVVAPVVGPLVASAVLALASFLPNLEFRRLFDAVSPGDLEDLVAGATANNPSYTPPRFENFLEIVCPVGFDTAPLVAALQQLVGNQQLVGLVECAYLMIPTEDAGVINATDPYFLNQKYLAPAPVGIGVESAWAKDADGDGCRLIDIEGGWLLNREVDDRHEDLPLNIPLLFGVNRKSNRSHGAGVLGVIAALDNKVGVVGIAPQANISVVSVVSPPGVFPDPDVPPDTHVAAMIAFAATKLAYGDVILVERQRQDLFPVEYDKAVFEMIRMVTNKGYVVVEAAGNGGYSLNNQPFLGDSGAILVGACNSAAPHWRFVNPLATWGIGASNFGTRIDCNAWGENVLTCGWGKDPIPNGVIATNAYFDFGGTSAASAIIAGVCLLIQQLHRKKNGVALSPRALRDILRDRNNGTLVTTSSLDDNIGYMPDLAKIIVNQSL